MAITAAPNASEVFRRRGFVVIPGVLDSAKLDVLREEAERLFNGRARPGVRRVLAASPIIAEFAASPGVRGLAHDMLGEEGRVVRSILFDKTADSNWDVPWHQDTTIAVRERSDVPGFGPWSIKADVHHVQPTSDVLAGMVTLRFHLDDCPSHNGALLVVPGSHERGLLGERAIVASECDRDSQVCEVMAGGAVVMRPLTLHASRKSAAPSRRRVIHLEFASRPLPGGLEWTDA